MKIEVIAAIFAALVQVAPAASADEKPDARALGVAEAMQAFCARVEPSVPSMYEGKIRRMVQGVGKQEIARVRLTDEYRQGHASADEFVAKIDEHNFGKACAETLAWNK